LDELDEFAAEHLVYELDALADRDFVFRCSPNSGIESIIVRRLRLALIQSQKTARHA
jgi:hypothetical protein